MKNELVLGSSACRYSQLGFRQELGGSQRGRREQWSVELGLTTGVDPPVDSIPGRMVVSHLFAAPFARMHVQMSAELSTGRMDSRVGSGHDFAGSGSKKSGPWTTLDVCIFALNSLGTI